ncbi:hypothetical protein [Trichormus azollae]|uniref:hypothetical protein n=1 Tax=Trichormus azollae TaxID=1164 RepID=UPI003D32E22D
MWKKQFSNIFVFRGYLAGVTEARNSLLPVRNDHRKIMRFVYDLFYVICTYNDVLNIGKSEGLKANFYSHLYFGLYYESECNLELAQEYIVKATDNYKVDDYMWYLAVVHKQVRKWN